MVKFNYKKMMKNADLKGLRFFLITAIAIMPNITAFSAPAALQRQWAEYLDNEIREMVERKNLPNAAIALVKNGEIVFLEGYGYADIEEGTEICPRTSLFRTGSVAKIFTWTSVMQLAERGDIDLSEDIGEYIDFTLSERIHGKGRHYYPAPVTLRHLLTHTAGFEDVLEGLFVLNPENFTTLREYLVNNIPARIYPPGTVMAYSNYGTALAGYIVQRVSGISFEQYIEENIFSPLGMGNSSFRQPLPGGLPDMLANAYRMVDGEFIQGEFEYMPSPAGGLSTTAEDMARFMIAHLNRGGGILHEQTVSRMHSRHFTHHPLLGGMAYGFMEYTRNGQRVVYHTGSSMLSDAGFYMIPGSDAGLFIVYSGGDFMGHTEIFNNFIDKFFQPDAPVHETGEEFQPFNEPVVPLNLAPGKPGGEYQQSRRIETRRDKLVNLLSMVMRVRPEGEEELMVSFLGSDHRYALKEPGIYEIVEGPVNYPLGPMQYIVVTKDPSERVMLVTDGPVTYIRMPFYATGWFAAVVAVFSILLALGKVLYFGVKGVSLFAGQRQRNAAEIINTPGFPARVVGIFHAALVLLMMLALASSGNPHPVYLLPPSAYGERTFMTFLVAVLPAVLILLSLPLFVYFIAVWRNRWWKKPARIYYTLYTLSALLLTWFFFFYNSIRV